MDLLKQIEPRIQYTDPVVSRRKFEREIADFKNNFHIHRSRGVFIAKADFPAMQLLFLVPQVKPTPLGFAVHLDFTNYDCEPPSVKFVDPFSGNLINRQQMLIQMFPQRTKHGGIADLLQAVEGQPPFLCIPGTWEYHAHPAHSGDSWFLYRTLGEGSLSFIIDQLHNHAILAAVGFQMTMNFVIGSLEIDPNRTPPP